MAFVNALPALLATLRTYRATLKQVFVSKDFQHGAHDGFSLVHPRLQVVAGGASGLSDFDHITLFTPFAPVGGKYESDTCGVVFF
jgi:hypothetical protein